jgi:hypothetical protein
MLWLDCDVTPTIKSRYVPRKGSESAARIATRLLNAKPEHEGQIGIYENSIGGKFFGYVCKYKDKPAYFEEPPADGSGDA